jgi:hypothetical protein
VSGLIGDVQEVADFLPSAEPRLGSSEQEASFQSFGRLVVDVQIESLSSSK